MIRINHKFKLLLITLGSFCLLLAISQLARAAESTWTTLIDGAEGLENFDIIGDANWTSEMAYIRATEGSGASWLVSKNSYDNFQLRVEFWASHDANSGVYMRCKDAERINDRDCYEANIFDQRSEAAYGTGGIVHVAPVEEPLPKAGDQWNIYLLTLDGDHLMVELNGRRTVDVRDDSLDSGPFALQWARGELRLRKVQIREL
ncbi:MAG: DUF1080 domain-containing protein [Gammaproteobacteria bacterium]|nr:DUF1080 domain-containing protein [Gammaproteobacteria bacterium]